MAELSGLITLKDVVNNVFVDLGDEARKAEYARLLQFAIRGYGELRQFHLKQVKEVSLTISDINTVDLPDDLSSFISIGMALNGRMWTFTKDDKILTPDGVECGEPTLNEDDGEGVAVGDGNYVSGYGVPGGRNVAYYRMDYENHRIILNQDLNTTTVRLRYISSGVSLDGETYLPKAALECMLAWVHWRRIVRSTKYSRIDKQEAERLYYDEVEKLREITGTSLEEFYDAIYETIMQTAKR